MVYETSIIETVERKPLFRGKNVRRKTTTFQSQI